MMIDKVLRIGYNKGVEGLKGFFILCYHNTVPGFGSSKKPFDLRQVARIGDYFFTAKNETSLLPEIASPFTLDANAVGGRGQ